MRAQNDRQPVDATVVRLPPRPVVRGV